VTCPEKPVREWPWLDCFLCEGARIDWRGVWCYRKELYRGLYCACEEFWPRSSCRRAVQRWLDAHPEQAHRVKQAWLPREGSNR